MVIQSHLKKLFGGIHNVVFDSENKKIVAMKSIAGEVVPLTNPVLITDHVEVTRRFIYSSILFCLCAMSLDFDDYISPSLSFLSCYLLLVLLFEAHFKRLADFTVLYCNVIMADSLSFFKKYFISYFILAGMAWRFSKRNEEHVDHPLKRLP